MTRLASSPSTASTLRHGASIAVFRGGAVLLVRRGRDPFRGLWSLPGGKIEPGEDPCCAALRELKEEAGIEAEVAGALDRIEVGAESGSGEGALYQLTVFYGRYASGVACAKSDAAEVAWLGLDGLSRLPMTEGTAALIIGAAERLDFGPITR
jgi:8-oxo-dGTP diphosphatase